MSGDRHSVYTPGSLWVNECDGGVLPFVCIFYLQDNFYLSEIWSREQHFWLKFKKKSKLKKESKSAFEKILSSLYTLLNYTSLTIHQMVSCVRVILSTAKVYLYHIFPQLHAFFLLYHVNKNISKYLIGLYMRLH